ncbi:MAG: UDP-N-acetylglucosamine 2-epimerase [Candidatus Methanoperedens nitroreducens]|uniref:UDP-N-acetylglucosamine 2-epimerase n=1 Tax=Candidatus Methanoperedens nitratireducens TaxID=1392998 RepID=A0A0P7ZBK3_9EURY|nr:UDP-N-acetylglucosamine 2-epimerase [Candidatus Methanoperedens sp. BLZ2]KAB2946576.1 MAG: UDP-N-acetylglucosamine 2-epimerase (hydrolyzing) [Candidatus Methanoperedens sp.]KPQ41950.1 MAG: UDP-N-acetylglucosamine 2-epimerase [Candidatus Methanoperedens sp. BLZ1]MBZ0175080.1 UDP-N-acetylglucosamine 2-epimerase [Candidatus Methanoperedens nitroreducens]
MKRKIVVITGTRAEYGLLHPVMKAIENNPKLELSVIATGMHLSREHGYTINEINKDGFKIDASIDMLLGNDTGAAMAKSLGIGIVGITQALEQIKPDIVLILGDRGEPFAGAIAATHMNIPVAHIHGGESTTGGCIDESIRHSITKFAHIHFPATKESGDRIKKLGEEMWRIHIVGAPGLDTILNAELIPGEQLIKNFSLTGDNPFLLVIQHPVTTQPENAADEMRITLNALMELKIQTILIYPNSDAGGRSMIEVIKEFEHLSFLHTFKSLPHIEYLSLMKIASVLVGNSSSGIIEAASFHLPVVNIGIRQDGRQCGCNVLNVAHDKSKIIEAIHTALHDKTFKQKVKQCTNPYGDGKAALRIAEVLAELEINKALLQKKITY